MTNTVGNIAAWVAAVGIGSTFPALGFAELEKVAFPCDGKTCHHWVPKLAPIAGWHQDQEVMTEFAINALVPDGYTYKTAEYVIYARAMHKPLVSDNPSLNRYIEQEKVDYLALNPRSTMTEIPAVSSGNGKNLRSFILKPEKQGTREQVTYSEEGEHFVVIVISSQTAEGYTKALPIYQRILASYR